MIAAARQTVARGIDLVQVRTNFEIGRHIVEHEQQGEQRAAYGKAVVKMLADKLSREFGSGFSETSLKTMRQFYLLYAERIGQTASDVFLPPAIGQTLSDQSAIPRHTSTPARPRPFSLSWSHYVFLLGIKNPDERSFYEIEAAGQNWTLRELKRQFDSGLYERLALSRDKEGIRKLAREGQIVSTPQDLLKEPLVLEFLGLAEQARYSESELEGAIIDRLGQFLLELGKGFLFEARQKRFSFDDEHFFVDLVFYNRLLRCHVLIDLKLGKLTHQDLGQMQMYVNYFDRHVRLEGENPTVGIVLCKKKHQALVEITLPRDANIHAREYRLYLPGKEELRQKLEEWMAEVGVWRVGWAIKALGEVCVFDKLQGLHKNLPYVGLEHIESHTAQFIGSTEPVSVKSATFRFSRQHILYGRLRPYLNKVFAPDFEGHCSTEIFPIKPKPGLSREYLLYWLLADETTEKINATCTGARMPRADMNEVLSFQFPLPPLPEQHRIIAILDEAFDGIASAKANAEQNLQNARALFESHLQQVFTERGEGWLESTVGDQLTLQRGFDITKDQQRDGEIPVVSSGGIKSFHDTPMAKAPGVVIGRKGTLGKCFFIDQDYWPHDTTLWVKDFKGNEPRFVYYLFLGLDVKHLDSGTANPALNRNQVHPIRISWPPVSQQQEFVRQFDSLAAETQRLESLYQQKLAALDELKKSLLHQAFSGQL